jgi:hypothetical protein
MDKKLAGRERVHSRLLVEGNDDLHVCYHLLKCHNIDIMEQDKLKVYQISVQAKIEILPQGGIEKLLSNIESELDKEDLRHLGILVDADEDLASRWQSLRNILVVCGYSAVPIIPDPKGTIIQEDDKPTVGVWMMPDNQLPGMLEDFCRLLVPDNDLLWKTAESAVRQAIERDRRFPEVHITKAQLHAWLAFQEVPGRPIGQAITKKYLDPQAPHAQYFIQWIRLLFETEAHSSQAILSEVTK